MARSSDLAHRLTFYDGASYGALKSLKGAYTFDGFTLHLDRLQSNPYAPPSSLRLQVPVEHTQVPRELLESQDSVTAVCDFIARDIADAIAQGPRDFGFSAPGQEILPRTNVDLADGTFEVRLTLAFPQQDAESRVGVQPPCWLRTCLIW